MTNLYQQLKTDLLTARKNKDTDSLSILQTLLGAIEQKLKDNSSKKLTEDEIVISTIKYFKNNIEVFLQANPEESIRLKLNKELSLLNTYLPTLLTNDELIKIISDNILDTIPKAMQYFKANYFGKYDAKVLAQLVKK